MTTLALEFSSSQRSVAVLESKPNGEAKVAEVVETGGRSTKAFGMVEEVLREAQVEREQVVCVVVGLGPGSYTGIRAAISIAQGWQLAGKVRLLGISSAEAVAVQAREEGLRGRIGVVIDAQRNEFYLANYDLTDVGWSELRSLRLATLAEVRAAAQLELVVGPEITRWIAAARVVFPRAAILARMAQTRTDFVVGEKLEPIYLRQTQFVKAPPSRIVS